MLSDARAFFSPTHTTACLNAPYGADIAGLLENVACNSASTPSRLEVALLRCRGFRRSLKFELREMHARFGGARCFLTRPSRETRMRSSSASLNAPYGARCFLTSSSCFSCLVWWCLNAPYGARCFLTYFTVAAYMLVCMVLMHLMALGAF